MKSCARRRLILPRRSSTAGSFLEEVWTDPNHSLRGEIDRFAVFLIERAKWEPEFAAQKIALLECELLASPEISDLAEGLWSAVKAFAERSANSENRLIEQRRAGLLREAGVHLAEDPDVRMEINRGSAATLESVSSRPIRAERPPSSLTRSRHGICANSS
jgi:uncharacterized membrane-anchored protein YjiN (DUF445 family)